MEKSQENIERILEQIRKPGFSTVGHGTSHEVVGEILKEGLYSNKADINSTCVPLNGNEGVFMKPWPHRNYRCVVVVQIPNPEGEVKGMRYFNSVFKELDESQKNDVGVQGADRSYVIPTCFIQGYVDLDTMSFIENPKYDQNAKVEVHALRKVGIIQESVHQQVSAETDPDDWVG